MIANVTESRLTDIAPTAGVPGLYVVENAYLERLLFDRNLVGVQFRRTCFEASKLFVRHLADDLAVSDIAELVILSKGVAGAMQAQLQGQVELKLRELEQVNRQVAELRNELRIAQQAREHAEAAYERLLVERDDHRLGFRRGA